MDKQKHLRRGSRMYSLFLLIENSLPVLLEENITFRTGCQRLNTTYAAWKKTGANVTYKQLYIELTDHPIVRLYLEEEKRLPDANEI